MDMAVESNGIELVSMVAMEDERAHHNALERKRRDHIKDSFYCLRDAVPQLRGEKASRALILNKATDYIKCLKSKNMCHKKEIDDIKKQNDVLEQEIDKIIKLNNSLGKDRIELQLGEDVLTLDKSDKPQSSPPTFTRITEKDKGPFIGKRNLDQKSLKCEEEGLGEEDEEEEQQEEEKKQADTSVTKITKSMIVRSENIVDNREITLKETTKATNGPAKLPTKINLAHSGGTILSGSGGTIQIPASALAKALPNGFKNVTAIYKQTGNNKPIRLQIITPNGTSKRIVATTGSPLTMRPNSPSCRQSSPVEQQNSPGKQQNMPTKQQFNIATKQQNIPTKQQNIPTKQQNIPTKQQNTHTKQQNILIKQLSTPTTLQRPAELQTSPVKKPDSPVRHLQTYSPPKNSAAKHQNTENSRTGKQQNAEPEQPTKPLQDDHHQPRTPLNQPLYARHRPLHSSPRKETKKSSGSPRLERLERLELRDKSGVSEFDSYKTQKNYTGQPNNEFDPPNRGNTRISRLHPRRNAKFNTSNQALARDPSAMATISESELAFLTRPSTNTGNVSTKERTIEPRAAAKIEHGNIPILYKGSLLSERDKEIDAEKEPVERQVLYSARAMDGSRPFACHICGKSFNMLSSLKVHEHIHVPVKKKPYPCDLCHRSFMTLRILSQHKESHYGRISYFHRQAALCKNRNKEQSSLGKKSMVSFATHPQSSKSSSSGHNPHSPRTAITNIFHVRASSPNDAPVEKSYNTVTITPSKNTVTIPPSTKSSNQRILPTTRVRQGQVIVQARPGGMSYKTRTKAESEQARNFGMKVFPLKRSSSFSDGSDKKIKSEPK